MKFSSSVLRLASAVTLAGLLASCGGESLVAFVPARILVFGDQASVITADGRKYTVNALDSTDSSAIDCTANPLWIQVLATSYGMVFPECPGSETTPNVAGLILAKPDATAAGTAEIDLAQQITNQLARPVSDGGGIGDSDLVTVYAGVNDVVAAYEYYENGGTQADAIAMAEQAGVALATQINRIADAGGKVITATVPDVGATPYAHDKGVEAATFLTYLTGRANARMLVEIENDGRKIGLIELNPYLINVVAYPSTYGYVNVRDAACVPEELLACTSDTLKTNTDGTSATAYTWLWAGNLQLGAGGHLQLGSLASSRAHNQPF